MVEMLLLAMLAKPAAPYEPPPQIFYHQAVACAASLKIVAGKEPTPAQFGDLMTWGMIMAETGRRIGRTKAQVAEPFYRHLKERKPAAFAAHRAYCQALFDADRP